MAWMESRVMAGILSHYYLKGGAKGGGINAVADQNLHGVEHFFEEFLEVTGLEVLSGSWGRRSRLPRESGCSSK
jgi:hypothetical protein